MIASNRSSDPFSQSGAGARIFTFGLMLLVVSGCQLILGDIPPKPSEDGGRARSEGDSSAQSGSGGAVPPDLADATTGDDTAAGAGGTSGAPTAAADATSNPVDANRDDATDAASDVEDAGETGVQDSAACRDAVPWYVDRDGDGVGTGEPVFQCSEPNSSSFSRLGGDCHDGNPLVHKGQTTYFGSSYFRLDGTTSFDYDCSGREDGDPQLLVAPEACGLLDLLGCTGSGYQTTLRGGAGVNPVCGSKTRVDCVGELGCQRLLSAADQPYGCR